MTPSGTLRNIAKLTAFIFGLAAGSVAAAEAFQTASVPVGSSTTSDALPICSTNGPVCTVAAVAVKDGNRYPGVSFGPLNNRQMYTSRLLTEAELASIAPISLTATGHTISSESEGWFDLWSVAESLQMPSESAVGLSFAIKSESAKQMYLTIGCLEEATVFQDGAAIYSTIGKKAFFRAEDIVRLRPFAGSAVIRVICRQREPWKEVPKEHYCSNWALQLGVYDSLETAWSKRTSFYFNMTPICTDISDIRLNGVTEQEIALCRGDGSVLRKGAVMADGTIRWLPQAADLTDSQLEGLFVIRLQSGNCDAILLTRDVDGYCRKALNETQARRVPFWDDRINHLLGVKLADRGDLWWKRKVVLALSFRADDTKHSSLLQQCRSLQIRTFTYTSEIDGTPQYFHLFVPRKHVLVSTVVVTPTPALPVRPPIESYRAAELWEAQQIAAVADELGICVILPIFVDVDYGGAIAQKELHRILDEAIRRVPSIGEHGIVPVGLCAGAISAMRFAHYDLRISALVLNSPMIQRRFVRWAPPADASTDFRNPAPLVELGSSLDRLSAIPVYLSYDSGMQGHGDYEGTIWLMKELEARKCDVSAVWPHLVYEYIWGERESQRYQDWFKWVVEAERRRTRPRDVPSVSAMDESFGTIKAAILKGFSIDEVNDPRLAKFRKHWIDLMSIYRGPLLTGRGTAPTRVKFAVVPTGPGNSQHQDALQQRTESPAVPSLTITASADLSVVEVKLSPEQLPPDVDLPRIDLLTEGVRRSMVWRYQSGKWMYSGDG